MTPELRRPDRRECELCGRRERWDDDADTWRIAESDPGDDSGSGGDRVAGDPFCIHEWDINGSFAPFEDR